MLSSFQFLIHILLSILFVYKLNMGVSGAMIALSMTSWFLMIGEFIYIFGGWCQDSWKGFTVAAFKDLVLLGAMDLWYYAVLVLLAGYMPNTEVAISAFTICYQRMFFLDINSWEFMISLGFYGARCVWVANELGRGNAKAVKFYHRQVGHGMFQQMTEEVIIIHKGRRGLYNCGYRERNASCGGSGLI
ncbi:hypothetical protein Hdeb2414_s0013g00408141 [Helianthus debilis subsp. tardiflorus]